MNYVNRTRIYLSYSSYLLFAWYFTHDGRKKVRLLLIEKAIEKDMDLPDLPRLPGEMELKFRLLVVD